MNIYEYIICDLYKCEPHFKVLKWKKRVYFCNYVSVWREIDLMSTAVYVVISVVLYESGNNCHWLNVVMWCYFGWFKVVSISSLKQHGNELSGLTSQHFFNCSILLR